MSQLLELRPGPGSAATLERGSLNSPAQKMVLAERFDKHRDRGNRLGHRRSRTVTPLDSSIYRGNRQAQEFRRGEMKIEASMAQGPFIQGYRRRIRSRDTPPVRTENTASTMTTRRLFLRHGSFCLLSPWLAAADCCRARHAVLGKRSVTGTSVTAITRTRDGYLWAAPRGLARLMAPLPPMDFARAVSINIRALLEDRAAADYGSAGGGGLSRLEDGRFTTLTVSDGLPSALSPSRRTGLDKSGSVQPGIGRMAGRQPRRPP